MAQPPANDKSEPVMTRFEAQRKLGLFAAHDYVMLTAIVLVWVTLGFWSLFGSPDALHLLAAAAVNLFLTQCWLVVLIYRCLVFILDLQADINLMPEAAARIVLGFWEGRRK